jgi:hypothetical protein
MQPDLSQARWRTSSYSGANNNCVEVASNLPGIVAVRDSKHPGGGQLVVPDEQWMAFVARVKTGQFDLP